jgi:hypothetical protein
MVQTIVDAVTHNPYRMSDVIAVLDGRWLVVIPGLSAKMALGGNQSVDRIVYVDLLGRLNVTVIGDDYGNGAPFRGVFDPSTDLAHPIVLNADSDPSGTKWLSPSTSNHVIDQARIGATFARTGAFPRAVRDLTVHCNFFTGLRVTSNKGGDAGAGRVDLTVSFVTNYESAGLFIDVIKHVISPLTNGGEQYGYSYLGSMLGVPTTIGGLSIVSVDLSGDAASAQPVNAWPYLVPLFPTGYDATRWNSSPFLADLLWTLSLVSDDDFVKIRYLFDTYVEYSTFTPTAI